MPTLKRVCGSIATSVLLAASTASAEDPNDKNAHPNVPCEPNETTQDCAGGAPAPVVIAPAPVVVEPTPPVPERAGRVDGRWYYGIGLGLSIGGGIEDFVGSAAADTTSTGGDWTVRGTLGTRSYIALEAAYIGSAQAIDALGIDRNSVLVGNGAQAALRLNLTRHGAAQPFAYGGAAWRHYRLSNTSVNTSDIASSDDVFEVPVGIGVAGYSSGFMLDVRAEYRGAWGNDLIPERAGNGNAVIGDIDRWGLTASLGVEL